VTKTTLGITRRRALSFTIILIVFLVVADSLIVIQQTNLLQNEFYEHTLNEIKLFDRLVSGALTKGDYVSVEEAVARWGGEQEDIIKLKITAANGYTIANYEQDHAALASQSFDASIDFGFNNHATITVIKDWSAVNDVIGKLVYQLIAFSVVLVALLGIALQRAAILPLQKEFNEHMQTEERLRQQAAALQESNRELESYSYSIAHDLRSPLRSITSFSQILGEEAGLKLNVEEKEYLKRIVTASKHMADLIDDILELGRITRSELQYTFVDLTALAKSIVKQIYIEDDNRKIDWQIHDNLTATGDRKLLALVLENLLRNAYKYTCKQNHAQIEFGSTIVTKGGKSRLTFFVRDNGVGFDMEYADKLFQPFQRLHTDDIFKGTGIGLATVQRIIHRHGGQVWASAEVDEGATFYFTLGAKSQ